MQMIPMTGKEVARYRRITGQIAHCIMRDVAGDIDTMSKGRDDYAHELFVRAWIALDRWRSKADMLCQGSTAEHRYICKCIWNKARTFERSRLSAQRCIPTVFLTESRGGLDTEFEERAIARQTLRMLRMRLELRDWRVLCQIAVSEGDRARGGTRKGQRQRQRAKKEAQQMSLFLESCEKRSSTSVAISGVTR